MHRTDFASAKRIVIKIGSSLLTEDGKGLHRAAIARWVDEVAALRLAGCDVLLVSSGAVAEGIARLQLPRRPKALHQLQAAAAVGQMGLVQAFEDNFQRHRLHSAQVLLTHDDLADRKRYLNARSTLLTLLDFAVVPVINENDTVASDEIRFGDNDTLAAQVANLIDAQLLIILTDQDGLFDTNPNTNPNAKLLSTSPASNPLLDKIAEGSNNDFARGGMYSKVIAARLAARSGAATVIAHGACYKIISRILGGDDIGTFLVPSVTPLAARKQWLAGQSQVKGELLLDQGATLSISEHGKSLLAVGVVSVQGEFKRGDLVVCLTPSRHKIASGLVNYNALEVGKIAGKASREFASILGYTGDTELIHRDNMLVVKC